MMITLGNNKAMKTFGNGRPTMFEFESFSELEHNKIDCPNDDGQYIEQQQQQINQQNLQTLQSKATLTGNQKVNYRSGSRVKVRTTLISISPPSSPTNQLTDNNNLTNTNSTTINNSTSINSNSVNKDHQKQQLINYNSPIRKVNNKKNLVRCESVDSINHMNGYSSVSSSCSTVINRPTIQKINWNNSNQNKIIKCQIEDLNDKKIYQIQNNNNNNNSSIITIKQSKTVDNLSSFMQPQQQHQTCPQFREQIQQKFTNQRTNIVNKDSSNKIILKEQQDNQQQQQQNLQINKTSSINNQTQQQQLNRNSMNTNNFIRTTNIVNTGYQLPQLTTQPLIAIRRILLLYENLQYKETAQFISRLQNNCFQIILRDLPVGLFIEQMPQSLVVLEALYTKLYSSLQELDCLYSNGALIVSSTQLSVLPELNSNQTVNHTIGRNLLKLLQPESVTMHLVKMFALKSHAHNSIYDCTSPSTNNNNHSHSNISSGGVFALMQERFDSNHPVMITMKKLLKTILVIQPPISKQLAARKRAIDAAIDAMGHHGLVSTGNTLSNSNISSGSSSSSSSSTSSSASNATSAGSPVNGCNNSMDGNSVLMMSLHEALKLEFDFVIQQYKLAVQKLDEAISSSNTSTTGKQLTPMKFTLRNLSKIPSSASHQRQLSLRPDEIQLRLMRNKSLLNSLEQYVLNQHSVQILMGILEQRINYDKETLFQFTQLRKEFNYCCTLSQQLASSFGGGAAAHGHTTREPNATMISGCVHNGEMNCCIDSNAIVAPVLMRFSFGCGQVLRVFEELTVEMATKQQEENEKAQQQQQQLSKVEEEKTELETVLETNTETTVTTKSEIEDKHINKISNSYCTESSSEQTKLSDINEINKTVINNQSYKDKTVNDQEQQLNEKVKHVEQLDNEETRQSSSDISGYHSDENTDYILNGSIQSGQQNCKGCLDGKRICSQSSHFFSRSSSSPLSSSSYSSCSSDLRNDDLTKKPISQNLVDTNQHHDLTNVETPISYLDNEQRCWTPQHSRYGDNELIILKRELIRSKETIFELQQTLQEREQQLLMKLKQPNSPQDLLTDNSIPKSMPDIALTPIPFSSSTSERRPCALIRKFGDLYSQARVDTLDSLDLIEQLKDADELKSKLLFSVVVLSFRSVQKSITDIKQKICNLLQIYDCDQPNQSTIKQLETAINCYFRANVETFDTSKNFEEVCNQIWTTLYDYPCLKESSGLNNYINDCVKLAWALSVQTPAYLIKFDSKLFDPDHHVRFHISDSTNLNIKNYLWPELIEEGDNGVCVHKGVVIT